MFISNLFPPVFVMRWTQQPQLAEVKRLGEQVQNTANLLGDQWVYVGIIPDGVPPPDAQVRPALQEGLVEARRTCISVHLVVEGGGLRGALIRAVLAGIMYETGKTRRTSLLAPVKVHASFREALVEARAQLVFDFDKVVTETQKDSRFF